jgi:uncharacterized protein YggE
MPLMRQEAKAMATDAMVAVQPGEQTIAAQVQITYELR